MCLLTTLEWILPCVQKLWPVKVTVGKLSETVSDTDSRLEKTDENCVARWRNPDETWRNTEIGNDAEKLPSGWPVVVEEGDMLVGDVFMFRFHDSAKYGLLLLVDEVV